MKQAATSCKLTLCLALLSAGPAFGQGTDDEAISTTAATAAYVYVNTTGGVQAYSATATGRLTSVGRPAPIIGDLRGVTHQFLISVGTYYLHSFHINPNGSVGGMAERIDTSDYAGGECGPTSFGGTLLSHSGKYFYVTVSDNGGAGNCAAVQGYRINSDGSFTHLGTDYNDAAVVDGNAYAGTLQAVASNDRYIYGHILDTSGTGIDQDLHGFYIGNGGIPEDIPHFTFNRPIPFSTYGPFNPNFLTVDGTGHLTVQMWSPGPYGAQDTQIGAYTIESDGSLITTNTTAQMPFDPNGGQPGTYVLSTSYDSKWLADGGTYGLTIMHMNGANPITTFESPYVNHDLIDFLAWDKNNNVYALSTSQNKLWVFHVNETTETVTLAPGAPYSIVNVIGNKPLIVVPN